MDDKIAETVEREASWLRGMDATRSADLLEALARDLAAARDRADHAWQRVAEADSAAIKAAAESLQHMLDKQAAEARVATLEASLSGGVLTKNDSLDLLQKLAAAEADRDRMAAELAEARTVQAAAGVLLNNPLLASRPGVSAMFEGRPVPTVTSYAHIDEIIYQWLMGLATKEGTRA